MSIAEDFADFWSHCPAKVGKLAAQKEYEKARKRGAQHEAIVDGLERYKQHKPAYADWCHPRTFLSQGRWLDEYDEPARRTSGEDWYDECGRLHGHECGLDRMRHHLRMQREEMLEGKP